MSKNVPISLNRRLEIETSTPFSAGVGMGPRVPILLFQLIDRDTRLDICIQ